MKLSCEVRSAVHVNPPIFILPTTPLPWALLCIPIHEIAGELKMGPIPILQTWQCHQISGRVGVRGRKQTSSLVDSSCLYSLSQGARVQGCILTVSFSKWNQEQLALPSAGPGNKQLPLFCWIVCGNFNPAELPCLKLLS